VGKKSHTKQEIKTASAVAPKAPCDTGNDSPLPPRWPRTVIGRLLIVAVGIIVGQTILYGPSLLGRKILLPLDQLASAGHYTPRGEGKQYVYARNRERSDLILVIEPLRHFVAEEMAAGRPPVWTPYQYAGTPTPFGKYSPMWVLRSSVRSPVVIAWVQLLISLLIGFGTYLFCRQVLQVGFWPAALAAWCYPMTGFFIFWEGYPLAWVAGWLPWLLWAVDKTVRRPGGWGGLAMAMFTYLTVADRQLDISGQVLLTSGIFAVWRLFDQFGWREFAPRWMASAAIDRGSGLLGRLMHAVRAIVTGWARGLRSFLARAALWRQVLAVAAGWALGFLLAAPCLLPTLEYAQTGFRMRQRGSGQEERPPVGLAALPQTVLPDMYGSSQRANIPMYPNNQGNQLESSSAAYAGLVAALLVAPLAWCSRRHRAMNVFLTALGFFGLCWCLDVPGVVNVLRLPGLNMMSHNRLVFVTSFCVIAMMAVGLDMLLRAEVRRQWWFWLPLAILTLLLGFCFYRTMELPEPLATQLPTFVSYGQSYEWIQNMKGVDEAQATFIRSFVVGGLLCAVGVAGWLVLWFAAKLPKWFVPLLATVLVADLLWFAYDRSAQCDPSMYYPRIPALEEVKKSTPGRIIGVGCLPALLNHFIPLGDVRGDDGVEPARMIDLAEIAADPRAPKISYAKTQWLVPKLTPSKSQGLRLSPVLDMLNVRYMVFRGSPSRDVRPDFISPDYWVLTNRRALPRAYVPERVETVKDDQQRLAKLAAEYFQPGEVAYVEERVQLPAACRGSAEIVEEVPTRVTLSLDMKTAGLVVLADLWDVGWNAYYNGSAVPILRANHALRGVVAPEGKGTLEFRYEPASTARGLRFCGLALLVLAGWALMAAWNSRRARRSSQ
jgi:hypothetical protein